jgi:guanine deaminase
MSHRGYRGALWTPTAGGEPRFLPDAILVVDSKGAIELVEPFARDRFTGPVLDLRPALIMPGLCDSHLHYPQTRIIGRAAGELLPWLEEVVFPEEARFQDESYAGVVARELVGHALSVGTTTMGVYSSSSPRATAILLEALALSGLRAVAGLTLMDQNAPSAICLAREPAIDACRQLIERFHGHDRDRLRFAVTPRFALSCSKELLAAAGDLAREHDLVIQTHVSENAREGRDTLEAHPYARDYLDVYDRAGLLTARSVFAHAIHLSPAEWDRIGEAGAKIAHCPDSNFFLGSGQMRLSEAQRRGISVGLGTDVAAGRTFDVRQIAARAFDTAALRQPHGPAGVAASPEDLLTLATLGGAEALGVSDVTGSLEPTKDADFIAVGVPEHAEGRAAILGYAAFGADLARIERVFIRGVLRHPVPDLWPR